MRTFKNSHRSTIWCGDNNEQAQKFGQEFRRIRKDLGLSQAEVAAILEVTQPTVSYIEAGTTMPFPDLVFRIERDFGVAAGSLSALLGYAPAGAEAWGNGVVANVLTTVRALRQKAEEAMAIPPLEAFGAMREVVKDFDSVGGDVFRDLAEEIDLVTVAVRRIVSEFLPAAITAQQEEFARLTELSV